MLTARRSLSHPLDRAAIRLHNGITELLSCDRDFSRFGRMKVVNPVLPS